MSKASIHIDLVFGKDEDNDDYVIAEAGVVDQENIQKYEHILLVNLMRILGDFIEPMLKAARENALEKLNSSSTKEEQIPTEKLNKGDKNE